MSERRYLDKYTTHDTLGFGVETPDGLFRPLDIVNGHLVVQRLPDATHITPPTHYEQMTRTRLDRFLEGLSIPPARKRGRPRKESNGA